MIKSFKYRLYPNQTQTRLLEEAMETHRRLYNECLEWRQLCWEVYKVGITFLDQRRWYTKIWRNHPYYFRLNNNSANKTIERIDLAFQAFFRRVKAGEKPGYPRFKGKGRFDSIQFGTYPNGLKLTGDRIRVQHIGSIKVKLHRNVEGKIKTASVKREADKWYVIFSCDLGELNVPKSDKPEVGIDVGVTNFLVTSNGEYEPNHRHLGRDLAELRRRQRSMCRKKKGGSNRRKAVKRVSKLHARIREQRRDHHHKTALNLVRRYGLIAAERLNISGMVRNRRLARSILDVAWGNFLSILRYKAECAGAELVEVDPRNTSRACSNCGHCEDDNRKSQAVFKCLKCGFSANADHNAAVNILAKARQARTGPAGAKPASRRVSPGSAACPNGFKFRARRAPRVKTFQGVLDFG